MSTNPYIRPVKNEFIPFTTGTTAGLNKPIKPINQKNDSIIITTAIPNSIHAAIELPRPLYFSSITLFSKWLATFKYGPHDNVKVVSKI